VIRAAYILDQQACPSLLINAVLVPLALSVR